MGLFSTSRWNRARCRTATRRTKPGPCKLEYLGRTIFRPAACIFHITGTHNAGSSHGQLHYINLHYSPRQEVKHTGMKGTPVQNQLTNIYKPFNRSNTQRSAN